MEEFYGKIMQAPLFEGLDEQALQRVLPCLQARVIPYAKDSFLLLAGDEITHIGVLLCGYAHVMQEGIQGETSILASLSEGDLFAEVFACAGVSVSPVTVQAQTPCDVLLLRFANLQTPCGHRCFFHVRLQENLVRILARKTLAMQQKVTVLGARSLREKVLLILRFHQKKAGEPFLLPMNRNEMAAYLCVDRSALSRELSGMQRDGVLRYVRNEFLLYF